MRRSGTIVAIAIMMVLFSARGQQPTGTQTAEDVTQLWQRFVDGYKKVDGPASDKLLEGMIQSMTPDADEATRKVQREAVKFLLDPNQGRNTAHLNNLVNNTTAAFEGGARTQTGNSGNAGNQVFCEECGKPLAGLSKFCPNCGKQRGTKPPFENTDATIIADTPEKVVRTILKNISEAPRNNANYFYPTSGSVIFYGRGQGLNSFSARTSNQYVEWLPTEKQWTHVIETIETKELGDSMASVFVTGHTESWRFDWKIIFTLTNEGGSWKVISMLQENAMPRK